MLRVLLCLDGRICIDGFLDFFLFLFKPTGSVRNLTFAPLPARQGLARAVQAAQTVSAVSASRGSCLKEARLSSSSRCPCRPRAPRRKCTAPEWHADRWSDECRNFLKSRAARTPCLSSPQAFCGRLPSAYTKSQLLLFSASDCCLCARPREIFFSSLAYSSFLWLFFLRHIFLTMCAAPFKGMFFFFADSSL